MIVVVIIPIALGVPTMCIFVPPAVAVIPAVGARFRKFMAPVVGLRTPRATVLYGLMKLVVRFNSALLAFIRTDDSRASEQKGGRE